MAAKASLWFLFCGSFLVQVCSADYAQHYLEEHCHRNSNITLYHTPPATRSIEFLATSRKNLDPSGCHVSLHFFAQNPSSGFLVTLEHLDVPGDRESCVDYIQVDGFVDVTVNGRRFCGKEFPTRNAVRTAGGRFGITWHSEPSDDHKKAAFRVIAVSYQSVNQSLWTSGKAVLLRHTSCSFRRGLLGGMVLL